MDQAYVEHYRDGQAHSVALGGGPLTVGRAATNSLALPADATLSAEHAVLEPTAQGWHIRDLGSTNGTFVNGQRLTDPIRLRSGDEIQLGGSRLVFREAQSDYLDVSEEWGGSAAAQPPAPPSRPAPAAPPPAPVRVDHPAAASQQSGTAQRAVSGAPESARRRGSGHVRGAARGNQVRRDHNGRESLVFRVERYDAAGNRLAPVAVQLSTLVSGQISDGEEVEVTGRWSHGTLRARQILNLSTGARVRGVGVGMTIMSTVIILLVLTFIVGIAIAGFFGS